MESAQVPAPYTRQNHTPEDRERVYQTYVTMETPHIGKAAELCGISPRTAEKWSAAENWPQRRASELLDRVAAIRRAVDVRLLNQAVKLTDRTIQLAMQDDDLPTAARMTIHALGLLGYTPVSKSASVTMNLGDGTSGSGGGSGPAGDARSLGEVIDAFNARLAALGAPLSPPQDIKNEDERKMTGGVPPTPGSDDSYSDHPSALGLTDEDFLNSALSEESAPRPDGGEGADGDDDGAVIEASFRETEERREQART